LLGKTKDGLWLCCIDVDRVDFGLGLLRTTWFEKTIGGGLHAFYLSKRPVEGIKRHDLKIELLGERNLVVVWPSKGYEKLNDNLPTVVENAQTVFFELVAKLGGELKPEAEKTVEAEGYGPELLAKWLKKVKEKLEVAGEGSQYYYCHCPFHRPDRNPSFALHKTKFYAVDYHTNEAFSLKQLAEKLGVELEGEEPVRLVLEELERQKAVRLHPLMDYHPQTGFSIGIFPLGNKKSLIFLAEKPFVSNSETIQLREPNPTLIHVKRLRWVKLHGEHAYILLQQAREFFEKGKIEFPAKNEVFSKVLGEILYYWWHSDSRYYTLVTCWVIGTYFHRLFAFFPALNPQGQRQTGKTTLLDIITQCAWNPTGRETAVREADLFRTIEGTRGTYILDITMLDKNKDTRDVIDVIETGTEVGGRVRRIHSKTGKPMEFETYGPKAIATRYELPFVAKCIRIITEQAPNHEYSKRRALIPFDKNWLHIKELLVKAAIKYWREVKDAYETLEQTDRLHGRAFNYWAPLLAVCKVFAPENFNDLLQLAEEHAEKGEKGDRLSEVENAVLAIFFEVEMGKQKTATMLLKELTQKVQNIVPWVKDWHIVVSALQNLGIIQKKYQTSKGVQYQISLEKARREAEARKLKEAEKETTSLKLEDLKAVYWTDKPLTEKECGVCGYVKPTVWQGETVRGDVIPVCEDCVMQFEKLRKIEGGESE